jgi:hypothetical protein
MRFKKNDEEEEDESGKSGHQIINKYKVKYNT